MISCSIKLGIDRETICHAETIEELLDKIRDFHTMSSFAYDYFKRKNLLENELNSGWYFKEN